MTTVFRATTIDPVLNYAGILGANASFLSRKPSVKSKQREETPSAGAQMWMGSRWLRKKAEEKCDFRGGWRLRTDRPEHSAAALHISKDQNGQNHPCATSSNYELLRRAWTINRLMGSLRFPVAKETVW